MKKDHTNLILTILIFIILISTLCIFLFFNTIQNKNEYTSEILATLSKKISDKNNVKILTKKFSELALTDEKIKGYFIKPGEINLFVDYLENIGLNNGAELVVESVEMGVKDKNIILVGVSVRGSFNNIIKILHLLENSPFYVDITQAFVNKEIKADETKTGVIPSVWQADISFSVLSLLE